MVGRPRNEMHHAVLIFICGVNIDINPEEGQQHHVSALPHQIQTAIVRSSICLSTIKQAIILVYLRNENGSTDKSSEHKGLWLVPHLVSIFVLCLLLYSSLNIAL